MIISPEHVAALRAYLLGDAESDSLNRPIVQRPEANQGYVALIYAAFCEAALQRFSSSFAVGDVVRAVADARALFQDAEYAIDPKTAESLVRRALGDRAADDIETSELDRANAQVHMLVYFVVTAGLDGAGIDDLLAKARGRAEHW